MIETVEFWLNDLIEGTSGLVIVLSMVAIFVIETVRLWIKRGLSKEYFAETASSLATQIPFYFSEVIVFGASIVVYYVLYYTVVPFHLPVNIWTVVSVIIAADFVYYWEHRISHKVRLLWVAHAVHHSSPVYNIATSFRFSIFDPVIAAVFTLALVLAGFHPILAIFGELVVLSYQGWIHTEAIGKLGPLERILNTPSHHRVHHGSDAKYLDKNFGGIFIIWDRLFGTFQAEEERPTYGLVQQINTQNPIKVWFSEIPALWRDMRGAPDWATALKYLTKPPGWSPKSDRAK